MEPFEPFRKDLLAGKTTIITGGGTGLGRSMALRVAGLGAKVGIVGRRREPLEETVAAIRAAGGQAAFSSADRTRIRSSLSSARRSIRGGAAGRSSGKPTIIVSWSSILGARCAHRPGPTAVSPTGLPCRG